MRPASRASSSSRGASSARALASSARQQLLPEDTALHHQVRVALGELAKGLGHGDGIAATAGRNEGDGRRPGQLVVEIEAQLTRREAHERVLVDLVLAACLAKRTAQGGEIADVDAAVLGEQDGIGVAEALCAPRRRRPPSLVSGCPSHLLSLAVWVDRRRMAPVVPAPECRWAPERPCPVSGSVRRCTSRERRRSVRRLRVRTLRGVEVRLVRWAGAVETAEPVTPRGAPEVCGERICSVVHPARPGGRALRG